MHAMTRFLSPLLLAATLAALHVAHSARSPPSTASEAPLANGTGTAPGPTNARRLQSIDLDKWCPNGADPYGCNLLGYTPNDIPAETTTRISMVGGLGGSPGHVSYCNTSGPDFKYATMIQIFTDQEHHRNFNYIDQITVTWSDKSSTRIGSCVRFLRGDCDWIMKRDSDKHIIYLSGGRVVNSLWMAVDGHGAKNPGDVGQLLGSLTMEIHKPSIPNFVEVKGYKTCNGCAGDEYEFLAPRVGSGVICGITYRSGFNVDAFGFVFYDKAPQL